jgi:hypothetical protein
MLPSMGKCGSKNSWGELGKINYEPSKNLMMGLLAGIFRDEVVHKVLRRQMGRCKTWNSAFANITQYVFPDPSNPLDEREIEIFEAKLSFVNWDIAMNGVTVEDIVRVLARLPQPFRASVKSKEDKLKFVEQVCLAFTFSPDDTADRVLTERMCAAIQSAAKNPTRRQRANWRPAVVEEWDDSFDVEDPYQTSSDDNFDP